MKRSRLIYAHALVFFFITYVICSFQTIIWYQFFGNFPAPFFPFILFVYFGLDKNDWRSAIYCYFSIFIYSFFTFSSLGILYLTSFFTYVFLLIIKNRIYWPGSAYFTIITFCSTFIFNILYLINSNFFEANGTPYLILDRIIQIVLTSVVSYFIYPAFKSIDIFLKPDSTPDIQGEAHG